VAQIKAVQTHDLQLNNLFPQGINDLHPGLEEAISASNRLFQVLDFCWRSPESGGEWYKSR